MNTQNDLPRLLELLALKLNPPHSPVVTPVDLTKLGAGNLELHGLSFAHAWLTGIQFAEAKLDNQAGVFAGACLESTDLSRVTGLEPNSFLDTNVIEARLPHNCEPDRKMNLLATPPTHRFRPIVATPPNSINSVCVWSDGFLVSGGEDGTVRVWSVREQKPLAELKGHSGVVWSVAALDEDRIVSGGDDGTVRVWPLRDGAMPQLFMGISAPGICLHAHEGGVRWINNERPWKTLMFNNEQFPNDPLLNQIAGFVSPDTLIPVPVAHCPRRYEDGSIAWDWDDPKNPRVFTQYWPKENAQTIKENILGVVRML